MTGNPEDEREELVPTFSQIVQAFTLQALMACGQVANPATGQAEASPPMARYHIGVLEVLAEKSAGNLTEEEERLLDTCLHQARSAFFDLDDILRQKREEPGH